LQSAKNNGITRTEAAEIITHIAFYAGWPKAWAAFNLAKEVWNEDVKGEDAKAAFQREMIFPIGEPNTAYAKYFKGNSYLAQISDSQIPFFNVTFEPGCRNNWHTHHATKGGGQMLVGVAGRGWYQEEGKPAQEILPGTVIHIPANVKHWHGAAKDMVLKKLSDDKFETKLSDLMRPILSFNEDDSVYQIWEKMLEKREHISIILDEYGCLRGVVSMEDIIETMTGVEIVDEDDVAVDMQAFAKEKSRKMLQKGK
jgi:quercetin dioxygenase-like cupin family protein